MGRMPPLSLELRGPVALLTLDNPPANALGSPVLGELARATETLRGEEIRYCQPEHAQLGGLLASNGRVHDEAVRALGR